MARTLKQLQDTIQSLIDDQGEDAPVAAMFFTRDDVFRLDDEGNQIYDLPSDVVENVLNDLEDDDHLFCEAFHLMDQYLLAYLEPTQSGN